jgi:hypothetical protein
MNIYIFLSIIIIPLNSQCLISQNYVSCTHDSNQQSCPTANCIYQTYQTNFINSNQIINKLICSNLTQS